MRRLWHRRTIRCKRKLADGTPCPKCGGTGQRRITVRNPALRRRRSKLMRSILKQLQRALLPQLNPITPKRKRSRKREGGL